MVDIDKREPSPQQKLETDIMRLKQFVADNVGDAGEPNTILIVTNSQDGKMERKTQTATDQMVTFVVLEKGHKTDMKITVSAKAVAAIQIYSDGIQWSSFGENTKATKVMVQKSPEGEIDYSFKEPHQIEVLGLQKEDQAFMKSVPPAALPLPPVNPNIKTETFEYINNIDDYLNDPERPIYKAPAPEEQMQGGDLLDVDPSRLPPLTSPDVKYDKSYLLNKVDTNNTDPGKADPVKPPQTPQVPFNPGIKSR